MKLGSGSMRWSSSVRGTADLAGPAPTVRAEGLATLAVWGMDVDARLLGAAGAAAPPGAGLASLPSLLLDCNTRQRARHDDGAPEAHTRKHRIRRSRGRDSQQRRGNILPRQEVGGGGASCANGHWAMAEELRASRRRWRGRKGARTIFPFILFSILAAGGCDFLLHRLRLRAGALCLHTANCRTWQAKGKGSGWLIKSSARAQSQPPTRRLRGAGRQVAVGCVVPAAQRAGQPFYALLPRLLRLSVRLPS